MRDEHQPSLASPPNFLPSLDSPGAGRIRPLSLRNLDTKRTPKIAEDSHETLDKWTMLTSSEESADPFQIYEEEEEVEEIGSGQGSREDYYYQR